MKIILKNILSYPSLISTVIAIFALLVAFSLQYIFNLLPCHLCVLQRHGYFIVLIFSVMGIFFKNNNIFPILTAFTILIIFTIAFWHKGIESYWWNPSSECQVMNNNIGSLEDTLEKVNKEKPAASCDQPSPSLFNITLVEWSLLYAFVSFVSLTSIIYIRILKIGRRM